MKKLFALCLAAVLLLSLSIPCLAAETMLARGEIPPLRENSVEAAGLKRLGILKGTDSGMELDRNVTRAEALALIQRTAGVEIGQFDFARSPFDDIQGHWACDIIESFYGLGYINGTGESTFEPDRFVTGQEFVKILLTVMGYEGVTLENAYEKGKEIDFLLNNFTKSVVFNNETLLRGDTARLCFNALTAKLPEGKMLYKKLIENGLYEESDFVGVLHGGSPAAYQENFVDKLNAQMPKDENYMFSPLSIKMAFAMAANGAGGETRSQILNALEIDDLNAYNQKSKELIAHYNQSELLKFNVANSIWINKDRMSLDFTETFKKTVQEFYNAEANSVTNDTVLAAINGWVDQQTNGKIKEIITTNEIEALLLNAIYFKGTWENEFHENATKKDTFTDRNGQQSQLDFMNRTGYMKYYKNGDVEIVELPYKNSAAHLDENGEYTGVDRYDFDVSMYAVKGTYRDGILKDLAENEKLKSEFVALSIPKFKIEYETELNNCMQNLGIKDAFIYKTADFDPMIENGMGEYFIKDSLHKTYIEIDEKGTEAAAVTSIGMAGSSLPPQPIDVKFNEPFTFVIRDNISGEVLFLGEFSFAK
ncbi:MAG TPA: hypothetical protein DD391_06620 [Clostridiales bacterium]|nr:hypothetical protein [Clostridiales bacterium]HBL82259.1 hypothetical protein [Clostridiales bacterium]